MAGDTFMCPPDASCGPPDDPPLADGAALDPSTASWRSIHASPVPFSSASTAVVDDDIYFLVAGHPGWRGAEPAFLTYSIGADAWEVLAQPPGDLGWYQLVAADGVVVAFSTSDEAGARSDLVFDPSVGAWEELPADPLSLGFDRTTFPQLSGSGNTQRMVVTAGTDAVVFGGERWSDDPDHDAGELLGDAWIWRSGRTP